MYILYYHLLVTAILIILFPFFFLFYNRKRFKERFGLGLPELGPSSTGRIWIHALSVGEVLSAVPLIEALKRKYPSREIVFSVKTVTGLEVALEKLRGKVHYLLPMPLDFWWSNRKMIKVIKPEVFILVETDIWPGLISSLKKRGIKTILVNGRVSPGTGRSYYKWRVIAGKVLKALELFLMQTELDEHRILKTGIPGEMVKVTGNIKFDSRWTPFTDNERAEWLNLLGLKKELVLVAGSTHSPEEKIILRVFGKLLKVMPNLFLIIGPRDAGRFDEVYNLARTFGFNAIRKTELSTVSSRALLHNSSGKNEKPDLLILDTLGELGRVYGLADVAFVGGSLAQTGGHNLLEPAFFEVPVLFGPYTFNFDAMSRLLVECGGGIRISSDQELFQNLRELLCHKKLRRETGERASEFVRQNQGALDRVMKIIEPYIL